MKTLLIIRHAKSSWDNLSLNDIDRPLNDRGKRDGPVMAGRLIKAGVKIDHFVSSSAKRARHTAEIFIHEFGRKGRDIILVPQLYHAQVQDFKTGDEVYGTSLDGGTYAEYIAVSPAVIALKPRTLDFMEAARLRDEMFSLQKRLKEMKDHLARLKEEGVEAID